MISAACLPLPRRAPCTCDVSGHTNVASTKALQTAQALCKSAIKPFLAIAPPSIFS